MGLSEPGRDGARAGRSGGRARLADRRICGCADEIGDRVTPAWCLAGLGSAAAFDEEPERAARLWGAAERLRAALGCRPAPAARATYERAVALARAQLGEEAFAAAWAAGQALTLDRGDRRGVEPLSGEAAEAR